MLYLGFKALLADAIKSVAPTREDFFTGGSRDSKTFQEGLFWADPE